MKTLAAALAHDRLAIAQGLAEPMGQWEKYRNDFAQLGAEGFARRETLGLVEYLVNHFRTQKAVWWDLYVGERLKQCHLPVMTQQQVLERRRTVFAVDCQYLSRLLSERASADEIERLKELYTQAIAAVTDQDMREYHILFIGDCLFLDLVSFLTAPMAANGIFLRPIFLTSKNPSVLRDDIRVASRQKFDLVCYSPYSYEFNLYLSQTHYSRGLLTARSELNRLTQSAHRQTEANIRLINELFECSLCVHNAANFRRHEGSFRSYVKNLMTRRSRVAAARRVNSLLEDFIADYNAGGGYPMVLIDERALLRQHGDLGLGRKFHDSGTFHPTVFSQVLADQYRDLIDGRVRLFGKKLVVTDLDNTLWAGIIGEGAVKHDHRRQRILGELRHKGVLLAIASKNDPEKVQWDGASLKERDFVASQINWQPKATNLKLIGEELNLKLKDFVFLDDRPDEREMVRITLPAVLPLDATSERTWGMLGWWAAMLPKQAEGDRTQLYHERRERQKYIDQGVEKLEAENLLSSLQLQIDFRRAPDGALPRVAELINRTNQFNTCGSRTTMQEVATWQRSQQHLILVADAADKFGGIGLISVMVLDIGPNAIEVPVWVLSCRLFGYGIETAMLNYVKRLCQKMGRTAVKGLLIETAGNQPCRTVYSSNGFTWDGEKWTCDAANATPDPKWLSIRADDMSQEGFRAA